MIEILKTALSYILSVFWFFFFFFFVVVSGGLVNPVLVAPSLLEVEI